MGRPLPLALVLLASLAGCRTVVEAPAEAEPRATYQTIANALPEADFGFGSPPGIAELSASAKAEGPPPELQPLKATERGFRIRAGGNDAATIEAGDAGG